MNDGSREVQEKTKRDKAATCLPFLSDHLLISIFLCAKRKAKVARLYSEKNNEFRCGEYGSLVSITWLSRWRNRSNQWRQLPRWRAPGSGQPIPPAIITTSRTWTKAMRKRYNLESVGVTATAVQSIKTRFQLVGQHVPSHKSRQAQNIHQSLMHS